MKQNVKKGTVRTHEGGIAQAVSPYLTLRRTVMNCLLFEDQFYESGESIAARIAELVKLCTPAEVSLLAIEAREKMRLRHAPLWLARCLLDHRGAKERASTIAAVVKRPDEAGELISLYWRDGKKKLPHALKQGIALAFREWNEYQLSKWSRDATIKLRDALFLCHPKPKDEAQAATWKKLAEKTLPPADTWEVALSACKTQEEKKAAWERLLTEKKLPGMATLMNLRNMLGVSVDMALIRERLSAGIGMALPFRFLTAARYAVELEPELDQAMLKGMAEMPKLDGRTIVLVDVSGSMDSALSSKGETTGIDAACGIAIHVREKCDDVMVATFSDALVQVPARRGMALRDAINNSQRHSSTQLAGALNLLKAASPGVDRLIVITDEQSQDGGVACWAKHGYVINVRSYQHGLSYGNGWQHIDGFSERVLDWIHEHERGHD